ncbi:MAG TPA: hypothetical protein DCY13_02270 [Verrucomicrobiales bacterium]|nr:hypothetical protein [Verrucomicrobiales bacterium]
MIVVNQKKNRSAGMSLVEVLMSMAIFGVSFYSLYAGMSVGFSFIGHARENLRATQIMVEKMETIRLYSWDQINTAGFIPATFSESYYPSATNGASGGAVYSGEVRILPGPTGHSYSSDMRRISISVNWRTGNRTQSRSMNTYVAKNGLQNYIY